MVTNTQRAPIPSFHGSPAKMKLVSNRVGYGPCPEPSDETEQRIVIDATGKVSVSRYLNGPGFGDRPVRRNTKRFRIPADIAAYTLQRLGDYFASDSELLFATDVGMWDLILTNTDGETFKYSGSLAPDDGGFFENISEAIRAQLNMPDLYVFDGMYASDRIERIELDYHRVRKFKTKEPIAQHLEYATWDLGERLTINREDDTIEYFQKIGLECDVLRRYHVLEGVSSFLDGLDVDSLFSEFLPAPADAVEDPLDLNEYTLKVHYLYGSTREITGIYDREGLPADWPEFMEELVSFLNFYSGGELTDFDVYAARRRRTSDLMYCSVEFEPEGKTYYYISDDASIAVDDMVEVPVGKDNKASTAKVVAVEFFSRDDAPLSPDKVKRVIRKIDR